MINKKIITLINKELDGQATKGDKKKIRKYLESNPEAVKFYNDMISTGNILDKVDLIDPPDSLKKNVMNSLNPNQYKEASKDFSFNTILDNIFKFKPRLAFAFVTGIFAGLLLYSLFFTDLSQHPTKIEELMGTMGMYESAEIAEYNSYDIKTEIVEGQISVKKIDKIFPLIFELQASQNCSLEIEYDSSLISFVIFNSKNSGEYLNLHENDSFKIEFLGSTRFSVLFELLTSGTSIVLNLYNNNRLIQSKEILLTSVD